MHVHGTWSLASVPAKQTGQPSSSHLVFMATSDQPALIKKQVSALRFHRGLLRFGVPACGVARETTISVEPYSEDAHYISHESCSPQALNAGHMPCPKRGDPDPGPPEPTPTQNSNLQGGLGPSNSNSTPGLGLSFSSGPKTTRKARKVRKRSLPFRWSLGLDRVKEFCRTLL